MRDRGCVRESEVLDTLQAGRWPAATDASLRDHVTGCAACTELLAIAAPLLDEHHALVQEAPVPSSAIVWWRAQRRSRRQAAEHAAQPISFVQGITFACIAGLLATALGLFVPTFRRSLALVADAAGFWSGLSLPAPADALADPLALATAAAVALCALALPIALYFTLRED